MEKIKLTVTTNDVITHIPCTEFQYSQKYRTLTVNGAEFHPTDYMNNASVKIEGPKEITFTNVEYFRAK